MNVLITGGLGFIGSNLAEKCVERGYNVTLISNSKSKIENIGGFENKVNLVVKDVNDISSEVRDMDYIFHLASKVSNKKISEDPISEINVNCNGTINILEACKNFNRNARIIYGSTFFVNGNVDELPVNQCTSCNPLSIYASTKLASENFCKIYNEVYGIDCVIARFTNVFGIKEQKDNLNKGVLNRMLSELTENKELKIYRGNSKRDWIYVSDVVDACLTLAEKGKSNEIYYVGRGEGTSIESLLEMGMKIIGKGSIKEVEPIGEIRDFYCDNSLLKSLGWKPKVSLREGIKKTLEWYLRGN